MRATRSRGALEHVAAARAAAARNGLLADGCVVVGELLARADVPRRADPDRLIHYLEPAVGPARVVDEPRDVAADCGVAAPRPVDAKHPDAPFGEIPLLARFAVAVPDQLARIVDDARVLRDRFAREDAETVEFRAPPREPGQAGGAVR